MDIRQISVHLATRVIQQAVEEGLKVDFQILLSKFTTPKSSIFLIFLQIGNKMCLEALEHGGEEELSEYIFSKMWFPDYRPLVYLPPGKGE